MDIARCFSKQFKKPLDKCLDSLQSEFQENIHWYLQFSTKTEGYIQSQVFKNITEKCNDSNVIDMFIEALSRISRAKVNIFSGTEGVSNIIVREQYQLEINILPL